MSSTHRGGVREPSDYYVTPIDAIATFLREWSRVEDLSGIKNIFDPCAGGTVNEHGIITVPMSYPAAILGVLDLFPILDTPVKALGGLSLCRREGAWRGVETMDVREDSPADIVRNYLTSEPSKVPDLIITNPPFVCALEIAQRALSHVRDGGFVVMLQRLNWLGSEKRSSWFKANMPQKIYVHAKRMGFKRHLMDLPVKERNATDSIEYAHFVWCKGDGRGMSQLRII